MGELTRGTAPPHAARTPYLLLAPNVFWLLVFMLGPIAMLAVISLHGYQPGTGILDTWSVDNYEKFLGDVFYRDVLWRTLGMGATTTVACLLLGFPLAFLLSRLRGIRRSVLYFLLLLPLLTSAVVRTFGWMILLGNNGFINRTLIALGVVDDPIRMMYSISGIVIALTEVLLPFMVLALDAALLNIDPHLYEAAQNLGARKVRIFFGVTLPLVVPGIVSGSVLVFTLAVSAFVTPSLIGGPRIKLMATLIYQQSMGLLNWPFGAAIAFVMLFTILVLFVVTFRMTTSRRAA
ncbi:MAG TPA: ABC transporter permease [Casimicrobiaceae bacterium]|nr:ABC transporter permease [Casimicrobiaceae bacterium]